MVAGAAQADTVGHIVEGAHDAVDGVAQGGALLLQVFHLLVQGRLPLLLGVKAVGNGPVGHHFKAQGGQKGEGGAVGAGFGDGIALLVPGAVKLPGDEAHISAGGDPAVQLAHGAADQVPGIFIFRVFTLDDGPEGWIGDDALSVQDQLPGKGDALGQVHKGADVVGDVLAHLAVAPAFGADQHPVPIEKGGGETVHFAHEIQGFPFKIGGKLPDIRGFPQGQQGMVVGNLLELAHGGKAHGGGGGICIHDAGFLLQGRQLIKKGVVLLVGNQAFVLIVIGVPVSVQPVHQFLHFIHVVNVPFLTAWPENENIESL